MLNNYELTEIADSLEIPLEAVVMKDEIPLKLKSTNYIINLQSSDEGSGSHWLNLLVRNKDALYVDPFGAPPPTEIIDAVKRNKLHLYYNAYIIQDIDSELCGYYAIGLLNYIKENKNMSLINAANEFINRYKDNTKLNGPILKKYLKPLYFNPALKQHLLKSK
jgi:hypothetical protein